MRTSDGIKAAEWILQNKDWARTSASRTTRSTRELGAERFRRHPLNKAIERLWAGRRRSPSRHGNYRPGGWPAASYVSHDPFVITVGEYDLRGSARIKNHEVPDWSAYGCTIEGFAGAGRRRAGRAVAPAPVGATVASRARADLAGGRLRSPARVRGPGRRGDGGPEILARKPHWTPDQVKGALMMSGPPDARASILQQGRGEVISSGGGLRPCTTSRRSAQPLRRRRAWAAGARSTRSPSTRA